MSSISHSITVTRSPAACGASAARPMRTRSTFGVSGSSRSPAPYPTRSIVIAGIGPNSEAKVVAISAPVGVTSSVCTRPL